MAPVLNYLINLVRRRATPDFKQVAIDFLKVRRNNEAAQCGTDSAGLRPLLWVWVVYLAVLQGAELQIGIEGPVDVLISVHEAIMQRREQTAGCVV